MAGAYADWRGHVIVCGLRGVGLRIVEQLSLAGVPAVVIDDDPDPRLARILLAWGVPHVAGSSRTAETLTSAGLAGATAVVCVQHDDLYTLETALLTRQLREDVRVVVQFGNPAVGRALTQVGVMVLDVAGLSAPSVVEACLRSAPAAGPGKPGPATAARRTRYVRHLALSLLQAGDRRLAVALAALLAVLAASTAGLSLAYQLSGARHLPVLDAAYFTVETITTVGYGDFSFRGQPPWLMAGAICLMLAGALFVAVFFALLTNIVVSRRISESLGRQRITGLNGHVLVIGLGSVGMRVVQQLADAGRDIVVVEKDEHNRHLGQVRALGVPVVIADATEPQVLESVRLASASAVAVMTSDDLANVETGLAVRDQLGPRWDSTPVVLRIFDPQLARSVKNTLRVHLRPLDRGAGRAVVRRRRARPGRAEHVLRRRRTAAGGPLTITPQGGLHGLAMHDLAARTRVLAIRRAADKAILEHPPRRSTRFRPDDEAYLIGPYSELLTVLRRDRPTPRASGSAPAARPLSRENG